MAKSLKASVVPVLLIWARESAGFSVEEAAKKVPTKPARLMSWEAGEDSPTVNQLRRLGIAYKRPIAVFFLPEPPKGWAALRDFRRLPGNIYGTFSPRLRLEIRRARERREIAIGLLKELGEPPSSIKITGTINDNPTLFAAKIRSFLAVDTATQFSWKTNYDSYNGWRDLIESRGILVVQSSRISTTEMRGFCISDRPLPTIGVNSADSPYGRVFTLIHELIHVIIYESGISDLYLEAARPPEEQKIEVFCNRVAGEVLVPSESLMAHSLLKNRTGSSWSYNELGTLSRLFGVSRQVVLRRLLDHGKTTKQFYSDQRDEWNKEYQLTSREKKTMYVPQERMAISSAGPAFVRLVLKSYYQEKITTSDASDYLNLRLKHFAKLETAVWGKSIMFREAM